MSNSHLVCFVIINFVNIRFHKLIIVLTKKKVKNFIRFRGKHVLKSELCIMKIISTFGKVLPLLKRLVYFIIFLTPKKTPSPAKTAKALSNKFTGSLAKNALN